MRKKIYFLILTMIMCTNGCAITRVTKEILAQQKDAYEKYLSGLSWQLAAPESVIFAGAQAKKYTKPEVDAIPASYPFLYDEGYKKIIGNFVSDFQVEKINWLLESYEEALRLKNPETYYAKRTLLHEVFQQKNIQYLNLNPSTTTEQIAQKVKLRQVNMERLFEIQLAEFFVKFYLGLT
jgi:hypothetical protein